MAPTDALSAGVKELEVILAEGPSAWLSKLA
jgi:hypothetical protein